MAANEKTITLFTTRVRQMILRFNQLKKENEELYAMVDERDTLIKSWNLRTSKHSVTTIR